MNYAVAGIAEQLKVARAKRKLSQRSLASKVGVPQSHISKIETGAVDLKLSSLLELSRALGLEVMVVPGRLVPSINALIQSAELSEGGHSEDRHRSRPAYRLDEDDDHG